MIGGGQPELKRPSRKSQRPRHDNSLPSIGGNNSFQTRSEYGKNHNNHNLDNLKPYQNSLKLEGVNNIPLKSKSGIKYEQDRINNIVPHNDYMMSNLPTSKFNKQAHSTKQMV